MGNTDCLPDCFENREMTLEQNKEAVVCDPRICGGRLLSRDLHWTVGRVVENYEPKCDGFSGLEHCFLPWYTW